MNGVNPGSGWDNYFRAKHSHTAPVAGCRYCPPSVPGEHRNVTAAQPCTSSPEPEGEPAPGSRLVAPVSLVGA